MAIAKTIPSAFQQEPRIRILRISEVIHLTGISRSNIYNKIADKEFPEPVVLSPRRVGWIESEVLDWIATRAHRSNQKRRKSLPIAA